MVLPSSMYLLPPLLFVVILLLTITSLYAMPAVISANEGIINNVVDPIKILNARRLGGPKSNLIVSEVCLGTMTWGMQNTPEEAYDQLDYAISMGINFIDAAEMYPVPTTEGWQPGMTETILGQYLEKIGKERRDQLVIATKVTGYVKGWEKIIQSRISALSDTNNDNVNNGGGKCDSGERKNDTRLDAISIKEACNASLKRLRTNRIDLYQIHWPDRYTPLWGQTRYDPSQSRYPHNEISIYETALALKELIDDGKIRYVGLSNESPYGICEWAHVMEKLGIKDRLVSVQNSYNLLDRRFETDGTAEACHRHQLGLLPWSVLAGGLLTGKYQKHRDVKKIESSRFVKYPESMPRWSPNTASNATLSAVDDYCSIAEHYFSTDISPTELALSFVRSGPYLGKGNDDHDTHNSDDKDNGDDTSFPGGSTIIGATTLEQLRKNIEPFVKRTILSSEVLQAIDHVHNQRPNPSCSL